MDPKAHAGRLDSTYRLLALCARAEGHPAFYQQLGAQLNAFSAWDLLPAQAEVHGIGALLWHHVRHAGLSIPREAQHLLGGLYLRSRHLSQVHARALVDTLEILEPAGMRPWVLKGLALACQYYPEPALRPVSDIDLLLRADDVIPALMLLEDAGFEVRLPAPDGKRLPKDLPALSTVRDGMRVCVELHHFDPGHRTPNDHLPDNEFLGLDVPPSMVAIQGRAVPTPAPLELLIYLSRHLSRHLFESTAARPLQLKWAADIVSLVERHADELDWNYLRQHHKTVIQQLEVFYSLTPMPARYAGIIPVRQTRPPAGLNQYPSGWPQQAFSVWRRAGMIRFVLRTLRPPSAWWLRLYYGIGERRCWGYGAIHYRVRILRRVLWALIRRIRERAGVQGHSI